MSRRRLLIVCAAIAVLLLAAVPTLFYPLTRDQGAYAYIADLLMHGGKPYQDAWDLKPPAVYLIYQAAFTFLGRTERAVRVVDVACALVSAIFVSALTMELFQRRRLAALAGWIYALSYYIGVHFYAVANPESFVVPFLAIASWGVVRGLRGNARAAWLVAGVASGFAFWFKPTTAVVTLSILGWAGLDLWAKRRDKTGPVSALGLALAGWLLGLLPIALYLQVRGLTELMGLWREYGTASYTSARGLVRGDGLLAVMDVLRWYVQEWQLLVCLCVAGAVAAVLRRREYSDIEVLPIFLLSSVAAVLWQGKYFEYHWIPALAPASALSAVSLVWLAQEVQLAQSRTGLREMRTVFAAVAITGLVLCVAYDNLGRYRRLAAYLTRGIDARQYYAQFDIGHDFSHMAALDAAEYLRGHTSPQETVLIWGAEPLVNFLAERRSPTRYIFSYMLFDDFVEGRYADRRADFIAELQQRTPAYIVLVENDVTPLTPNGSLALLEEFPALQDLLEGDYRFEAQLEDYLFYRRKQPSYVEAPA